MKLVILRQRLRVWARRLRTLACRPFKRCERCGRLGAETYHQHTCYVEKERNIVTLCPGCKSLNDEYWEERWMEIRY